LQLLRQHHDPKRQLLQMHELRQHQRVFINKPKEYAKGRKLRKWRKGKRVANTPDSTSILRGNAACSPVEERPFKGRVRVLRFDTL
jgi:hypothetical protein